MNKIINTKCSFCGKTPNQVKRVVTGPNANICDECLVLCNEIVAEEFQHLENERKKKIPTPKEIFEHLDEYVIGQSAAKRALSVAVYNHYKRIGPFGVKSDDLVEISKSNILLMGPTGTGKTYLAQTLARMMDVPFVIVDATALTEAGYIGEDVENILSRLIQNAEGDLEKASRGIIYIDEIDKLARRGDSANLTRDVSGEGVQQALLKIIEGTVASVPESGNGRKHPGQQFTQLDTSNILFIASGAFWGLEEIIAKRVNKTAVGFGVDVVSKSDALANVSFADVQMEDLHQYGLIPEFIGRLPVVTYVEELEIDQLKAVLMQPKNSLIKQYKRLFEIDGVYLQFEDGAIAEISRIAAERGTGARGLRSIVERILEPLMFELPSRSDVEGIVITAEYIANFSADETGSNAKIIYRAPSTNTSTLSSLPAQNAA